MQNEGPKPNFNTYSYGHDAWRNTMFVKFDMVVIITLK